MQAGNTQEKCYTSEESRENQSLLRIWAFKTIRIMSLMKIVLEVYVDLHCHNDITKQKDIQSSISMIPWAKVFYDYMISTARTFITISSWVVTRFQNGTHISTSIQS